jgi:hypothetical protein
MTPHTSRQPWWQVGAVVALALLVSSGVTTAAALYAEVWFTFELSDVTYEFGLFYCTDCPDEHAKYSTDCFRTYDCLLNSNSNLCRVGEAAYEASISYIWFALISLVGSLFLVERLIFLLLRRDYGHPKVLYCLAIAIPLFQGVGVFVWFTRSDAKFSKSSSVQADEQIHLYANLGPILAICGVILSSLAAAFVLLVMLWRDTSFDKGVQGVGEGLIMGTTHRQWLLGKVAPVLGIGLAFHVMATCWHWVNYDADHNHNGFLLYVDSYLDYDQLSYNCLFGPACAQSNDKPIDIRNCTAYKRLWSAGYAYLWIDSAALIFFLLWIEGLVYLAMKREYGVPFVQYVWPLLTTLVHLAALVTWFMVSGAEYGASCNVYVSDVDINFCADMSPSFSIWALICYFFAALVYELLYLRRKERFEVTAEEVPIKVKNERLPIKAKNQLQFRGKVSGYNLGGDLDETRFNDSMFSPTGSFASKSTGLRLSKGSNLSQFGWNEEAEEDAFGRAEEFVCEPRVRFAPGV